MYNFLKHTLLISATLVVTKINAQQNFIKGYIVPLAGDTIKGEVKTNPKKEFDYHNKVIFKDAQGVQKTYKPNKVKAYGFDINNYAAMDIGGEEKYYKIIVTGEISMYKMIFEEVKMNETSYVPEYFLMKKGDKKMTDVNPKKFKKQLQEMMSGAAGYANEYKGEKEIDEKSAAEVISAYNKRPN